MTRLSPLQAVLSITVVDDVPLPAGEEFTGVIRAQDVRATEKDKVKIADCFRGGDVVKGLVVSPCHRERFSQRPQRSLHLRYHWVMRVHIM